MNGSTLPRVYEFSYASGRWSDRPSAPINPPRGKTRKGQLYVMVDVEGGDAPATADRLREDVARLFFRDPSGSLTSALVRAIQVVNQELFAENERSLRPEREFATICCAVFRDGDAYFALAGRGLGYLVRADRGERFGRGAPRPGEPPPSLIGQSDDIEVELHHRSVDAPTAVILTSTGLIDLVGEHSDDALRGRPDRVVDGLRSIGRGHRGPRSFHALVIVPDADPRPSASEHREPTGSLPIPRRSPPPTVRMPKAPGRRDGIPDEPLDAAAAIDEEGDDDPAAAERLVAEDADWDAVDFAVPRQRRPRLWVLPRRPDRIAVVLALIAVLFFVGYVGVLMVARIVQGGAPFTDAMSHLAQAQQFERDATGQSDPLVRRHLLDEANQLASQALAARSDDPFTITTAARIRREYQAASGIVDLPAPSPVVALPTTSDQLILEGSDLYVLDRTNSRIYKYLLSADGTIAQSSPNPILVQAGDRIGPSTVSKITSMAWMPASDKWPAASLLALDSSGFLIQYEPMNGLTTLNLRDPGSWQGMTAVGGFGGSLYALSASQQSLASYPVQSSGFDGPVYNYFASGTQADLSDAVDFAVDGDVFLLHASGQIQRFSQGKSASFVGTPADLLPTHPSGLAVDRDSVFVGDPGHARIIQISRAGVYLRALSAADAPTVLANLRDLA
ncbi:MAG: hypothetical protein ACRDIY_23395, partial [Chloroflexota bacterium]